MPYQENSAVRKNSAVSGGHAAFRELQELQESRNIVCSYDVLMHALLVPSSRTRGLTGSGALGVTSDWLKSV